MRTHLSKALGLAVLLLIAFSFLFAAPAHGQEGGYAPPTPMPIWVTFNASAQGNYPGGDEQFYAFAVNSAQNASETEIIDNMTLSSPFQKNFGPGLPATLLPGESVLVTITLEIPKNYSQNTFSGNLLVHARIWNGTTYKAVSLSGAAVVSVFNQTPQSTVQTTTQSGTISTPLFAAGVAVPSIIVVLLLVLLLRSRTGTKM